MEGSLMRHLRWKRNYISGYTSLDRPKKALYEDLQVLQAELEHKEHCQDMEDLMDDIKAQARNLFEAKAESREQAEGVLYGHRAAIAQTLEQRLPLTALDTPACRDCAICEHTGELVAKWLEQSASPDEEKKDVAA